MSKTWIPKGLKIFEKLKVILLVEDKVGGKFKGKKLIFTPENLEEINIKTVAEETINGKIITGETVSGKTITGKTVTEETVSGKSVDGFLKTSEDILLLEDNKRIEDIKNTHTGEDKKVDDNLQREEEFEKDKLSDTPMEIQDILKKYRDLELPDFKYPPENYIILRVYRELGIAKLYEALTLMPKSEFVKNNMSINAIFKIENLKKALNGNFKDKTGIGKKSIPDTKKEFKEPVYEDFTGDFIKNLLNGTAGGK